MLSKALDTNLPELYACSDQRLNSIEKGLLAADLQSTGINFAIRMYKYIYGFLPSMRTASYALRTQYTSNRNKPETVCLAVCSSAKPIQGEPAMRIVLFDMLLKP